MNNIINRVWNRGTMVNIEDLRGSLYQNEQLGHTFVISGVDGDGNVVSLSGTVDGAFLRPDNTTVAISGSASGGKAYVTLPANCYDVPGKCGLTIYLTADSQKTALYAAVVTVTRTSSDTASPGTTASVVDLVNAINAAISQIPATDTALKAAMAPTYSNTGLYAVGSYAWYNGVLKRCIVPITTAESYTAAHWTDAALGNDLRDLKSALNVVLENQFYDFIDKHYINLSGTVGSDVVDLTPQEGNGYKYTIVSCTAGDVFGIRCASGNSDTFRSYAFLNSSNVIIKAARTTHTGEEIVAPENATKLILNDLKSVISDPYCYKNVLIHKQLNELTGDRNIDYGTLIADYYIDATNGRSVSNSGYSCTDFVNITTQKIKINRPFDSDAGFLFYDKYKKFIPGSGVTSTSGLRGKELIVDVPENAVYFRSSIMDGYTLLAVEVGNYSNSIKNLYKTNNFLRVLPLTQYDIIANSYLDNTGFFNKDTNYVRTTYIDLQDSEYVQVTSIVNQYFGLAFYDKWKKLIVVLNNSNISQYGSITGTLNRIIKIPDNARYFIATLKTSDYSDPNSFGVILIGHKTETEIPVLMAPYEQEMGRVLCIGDSLTETYSSGDVTYPQWFARLTGLEVTNKGHSGYSAKDWWNEEGESIDFSQYDSFIVWLGTNGGLTDSLETGVIPYNDYHDYADTNTGCYCRILSKIISVKPNARIFLGTVYTTTANQATTNSTIYKIAELDRYASNVVGVCNNHDDECRKGLTPQMEAFHPYNDGGTHFGEIGNLFLANHWITRIRQVIYDNMALYT